MVTFEEPEPNEADSTGIAISNEEAKQEEETAQSVSARNERHFARSARPGFADHGRKSVIEIVRDLDVDETEYYCCPNGTLDKHGLALVFGVLAMILTFTGGWHCSYFTGATTPFSGNSYGIWTVEDIYGDCQTWDTIYGSIELDSSLKAARAMSMIGILLGLSLVTAMTQALRCYFLAGVVLFFFVLMAILSLSIAPRFNPWAFFFLFFYMITIIIVRAIFIHPVHRVISRRGSIVIASMLLVTFLLSILSLVALNSDYCQCTNMGVIFDGQNEYVGSFEDVCENKCELGTAGILTIIGSSLWLFAAIATLMFGVQPKDFQTEENADVAGYNKYSMYTYAAKKANAVVEAGKETRDKLKELANKGEGTGSSEQVKALDAVKVEEEADSKNDVDTEYERPPGLDEVLKDDEYDEDHKRTFCQRCCFDYRVSERSKKEKCIFWTFRVAEVMMFVIFTVIVVMLIGAKHQNDKAGRAPSTSPSFITNVTCAFNADDKSAPWKTYDSPEAAHAANMTIAHCGACGECSNMWDTEVYVLSRDNISDLIKKNCGFKAILFGYDKTLSCMKDTLDFTDGCDLRGSYDECLFSL
mmetsp:Transcript_7923/g.11389  ORF Transcript_7923/g.11389 Transcript_7923/m.11389 type:complete len:587 (-) Transcript_7923:20-1780(-)